MEHRLDTVFAIWFAAGWLVFAWALLMMLWGAFRAGGLSVSTYLGGTFLLTNYNRKYFRVFLCAFGWCLLGAISYLVLSA